MLIDDQTTVERALDNLALTIDSDRKENSQNLEYIDRRFPDKVFYSYKN